MGQRSQIYVRQNTKEGKHFLVARYFHWNYGERMISRARYTMEWIKEYRPYLYIWEDCINRKKLEQIINVNFDMKDIVLSSDIIDCFSDDYKMSFNDFVFKRQANNDGKLFIDIYPNTIKYCFLNSEADINKIMDAEQYMHWDSEDWENNKYIDKEQKTFCKRNIRIINKTAKLMTKSEIQDFLTCEYEEEPKPLF